MALIRMGSLVTRISGKIGGQTFGTSSSGSYIRNTGTPRKAITLNQKAKMSLMATTAQSWRALTQAQRDVFISASPHYTYLNSVGETKNYSGYAIYAQLKNNVRASSISEPEDTLPVPLPRFTFTPFSSAYVADTKFDMVFYGADPQEGVEYRVFVTKESSRGISSGYRNFFYINKGVKVGTDPVEIEISDFMVAKWGTIAKNSKIFWRVDAVHLATGQSLKGIASGSVEWLT